MESLADRLNGLMTRITGPGTLRDLARLSGGANMESWAFDWVLAGGDTLELVLRRSPSDALMAGRTYGHDIEAALVRAAHDAGTLAPRVVGELTPTDDMGSGYVMQRLKGDVSPPAVLAQPAPGLLDDIAAQLALIHAMDVSALPQGLATLQPHAALAELHRRFVEDYGGDRPVMALALRWLADHCPEDVAAPVFLHGDFRIGNLMADAHGLSAVLDWELCHLGDRHQDLAFGCITSWRFGHIDRPAFGLCPFEQLWAAYERVSGVAVDEGRFRWWLVYSTLWWGMCCLQMASIWRSGADRSLERAVIGRRTSETEVDLLLLLEDDAPASERVPIDLPHPPAPRALGEPSAPELINAISEWLAQDIKPGAQGRDRFMVAVAINALGMLGREAAALPDVIDKALSDDLLSGKQGLATPGLLARLKTQSFAKLATDQPKYPALAQARQKWSGT